MIHSLQVKLDQLLKYKNSYIYLQILLESFKSITFMFVETFLWNAKEGNYKTEEICKNLYVSGQRKFKTVGNTTVVGKQHDSTLMNRQVDTWMM